MNRTFSALSRQPAHRSFWRTGLERRAGTSTVDDWLVDEANRHGIFGASGARLPVGQPTVPLEEIVVGLLMPHGAADGRLFKLVVRIVQTGRVDVARLALLARRERADHVLWWLLDLVPPPERSPAVERAVVALGGPPRGYRPPRYRYDARRLLSRENRTLTWPRTPPRP